jgi:hypothetical protein
MSTKENPMIIKETTKYGEKIATWTINDTVVTAVTTNMYEGYDSAGAGTVTVSVHHGRLDVVSFNHRWAVGAARELAAVIYNAGHPAPGVDTAPAV